MGSFSTSCVACWRASLALTIAIAACDTSSDAATKRPGDDKPVDELKFVNPFPSPEEIEKLAADPPKETPELPKFANVGQWTFAGPAPSRAGDVPLTEAPGEAGVIIGVGKKVAPNLQPTEGLFCAARELGRFILAHKREAPPDIQAFILSRCGVTHRFFLRNYAYQEGARHRPLRGKEGAEFIGQRLGELPEGSMYGMWAGGDKSGRVAYVGLVSDPGFVVDPFPMSVEDTKLRFRGKLTRDYGRAYAFATKGLTDYAWCSPIVEEMSDGRTLAFECPLDRAVAAATIEVAVAHRGQPLSQLQARLFVSPDGSMPTTYDVAEFVQTMDKGAAASDEIEAINAMRKRLGRPPVVASPEESSVVAKLLPHWVSAQSNQAQARLSVALMAGWGVDGLVSGAGLSTTMGRADWTAPRRIAAAMASPVFRATALHPETLVIATSSVTGGEARFWLDVGYGLFRPVPFDRQEKAIFDALDQRRRDAGQPPILRVEGKNDRAVLDAAASRVRGGKSQPMAELNGLLEHFANETGQMFRGMIMVPLDIEGWYPPFPDVLVNEPNIAAALKVTYFNPDEGPWGRWLVMIVYTVLRGPPKSAG